MPQPPRNATFQPRQESPHGVPASCLPNLASQTAGDSVSRTIETVLIDASRVVDVLRALDHASHIGLTPTRHVTIDWEYLGVHQPVQATGRFLKYVKDAMRKRGWPTGHIWIRETGRKMGDHVHILLHLPPDAVGWLNRLMPRWLKKCGARRRRGGCKTTIVTGRPLTPDPAEPLGALHQANIERVTAYILKHCDSAVAEAFGIGSRGPCTVLGKRVSISRNLHHKARRTCQKCAGERAI